MSWYNTVINPVVSFYNKCKPESNPRIYPEVQSSSGDRNAMRKQSKRTLKNKRDLPDENYEKPTAMVSRTSSSTTDRLPRVKLFALSQTHETTDVPVSFLFLFLLLLWIFSGIFVIHKGEITKFLVPKDSKGRYCSEHNNVLDKPNVFFFDNPETYEEFLFGRNTTQICVKHCPSENFNFNQHVSEDNWNLTKLKMLCSNYTLPDTYKEAKSLVEKKQCASTYVVSSPVKNRCFPLNSTVSSDLTWFDLWINNFLEVIISSPTVKEYVVHFADDIQQTYPVIIRSVCYGLVVTFVYIALLRWIAGYLVWSTMFLTTIILGALIINTYIQYSYYSAFPDSKVQLNFLRPDSFISYFTTNTTIYFIIFVVLLILLIVLICTIMFLQEQIKISIALIKESSKAVTSAFPILPFPVFPLLCQILCILFAGTVYTSLTSISIFNYQVKIYSNNATSCICDNVLYKDKSSCNPRLFKELCEFSSPCSIARCEQDTSAVNWYIEPLKWLNFIMFLWTFYFISDAKKMVLAFVFSTWYWSFDKSKLICKLHLSIYYTFRYHTGTIALGSLIITIFKLIKYLFTKLYNKFDKLDSNYKKTAKICCNVLFIIFEKFLRILSENAYIMSAIYGKDFMYSAKKSFFLLLKNPLRYYVLNKSICLLFLLARVVISSLIAGLVYIAFHTVHKDVKLTYKLTPVITACVLTFFVSKILFTIYEMAVYTIFICFCEDCEINDGSAQRPYYMANKLKNILPKNKDDDSELLNMAVQRTNL